MNRPRTLIPVLVLLAGAAWATACGDGATEPPPVDPPRATTVVVTPATVELTALGEVVRFTAQVRDQHGSEMAAAVVWSSGDASVATVDATGLVTAAGNGTATITAMAGAASGNASVTVAQAVSAVAVSPVADTLVARGDTVRLTAEASNANGHAVEGAEFTWTSGDTAVATVDATGLATSVGSGEAEITASSSGVAGRASLTVVDPVPTAVAVTPDTLALTTLGQTAQLAAEVRDQIGRVMEGVRVSWSSANAVVAAVDSAGVVTAIGGSSATVTARAGEASGSALMKVMPSAGWVAVSPTTDTIAPGDTVRLAAELYDASGHRVSAAAFNWSTSDKSVASVDGAGLVRGVSEGAVTITARAGEAFGVSEITVANLERAAPVALYEAMDGPNWTNSDNWLTDAPLGDWYGVRTDGSGRVVSLDLGGEWDRENREWIRHGLSGPIPHELGNLVNLDRLELDANNFTGPIPPELGRLANLVSLWLESNSLTGPLPPELGGLTNLKELRLQDNELTGTLPPEFGRLENLTSVVLARNGRMSGELPAGLTDLGRLEELLAADTGLCAPADAGFPDWLSGVPKRRVGTCGAEAPPAAYLSQAVQSRDHPVPLVAGKGALLRVFVASSRESGANFPPVRATFYRNGARAYVVDIPGKPVPIPQEIREVDLNASANAQIPGRVVQPGLEMVIDIDPEGTLGPNAGVMKRIPESGRLAVDVRTVPVFELTMIPFLWTPSPDSSIVETIAGMAQDPGGHSLLSDTRNLLPINELEVKAHAPVWSSTNNAYALLGQTDMIRVMEGGSGHYVGMMEEPVSGGAAGLARRPGWVTFSRVIPKTMAHELGHNLSLYHAPCGNPSFREPSYPGNDGRIGGWGYDFSKPGRLLPPVWPDLMSYCRRTSRWIGEYHFTNALRYRLHTSGGGEGSALVVAQAKSLLLWGGVGSDGTPFLEPAFVVDAVAATPRSAGEFEIIGRDADGEELFSFSFSMPKVADGDGRSSFVFALPVRPGWDEELASISLSGPGGAVMLDEETDRPVTILRDSGTGEIRGIFRGVAGGSGSGDDAVSALVLEPGVEVLVSRGIPEAEDWRR